MTSSLHSPGSEATILATHSIAIERIFPIRNLVSSEERYQNDIDDDASTPLAEQGPGPVGVKPESTLPELVTLEYEQPPWPRIPPEATIRRLTPSLPASDESNDLDLPSRYISERSQMVPETHGGLPGVVPGVVAASASQGFTRCEDEPIRIPGAVQSHGVLVALKYDVQRKLLVRVVSENCQDILEFSAEGLFKAGSFLDLLGSDQKDDFQARVDHILEMGHNKSGNTDLDIFTLSLVHVKQEQALPLQSEDHVPKEPLGEIKEHSFWCAMHLSEGTDDLIICEFERQSDKFFPGVPGEATLPKVPTRTLDNDVVEEERLKSITIMSKPLRVLEIARRQHHRIGFMEMFNAMSQVQQQLAACTSLQELLGTTVGLVQEITHFHRVMVNRFDQHNNGSVDAEIVDPRASEDLFRGLHFPATDIPSQARDLYKLNKIRMLHDIDKETARLVCRDASDFRKPLDLTHSYLRAISPIHLKYLANMGVRSSMSISLVINEELWGLVACHSYGEVGIRVPLPIRELCRNIGECASMNIERLIMQGQLRNRTAPTGSKLRQNPSGFIAASSAELLRMFDADFGLLSIQDEARAIGRLEPYGEALALLTHLQRQRSSVIHASQNVTQDFPDLVYEPGINAIAGMLKIPLSISGSDFIVFFRRGQLKEVRWAGNPYEKLMKSGSAQYLEPRSSFKRWTERVVGSSRDWTNDQIETASILSLLYGRFIEVWRQKEIAVKKSRLTRLLLQNSSHEMRTPLNAIINYIELALENNLDRDTKEILKNAHKASRSMIYVIDDLLNLTKVEGGQVASPSETFWLSLTVSDVMKTFENEASRKGLNLTIFIHPGVPQTVQGDASRLRQVLSNVMSNAFEYCEEGDINLNITATAMDEDRSMISMTVQDSGIGMSESQLDDLFQEFEQIFDNEEYPKLSPELPENESKALGLGLAVVVRYVRNLNGQIKIRSELGKGTVFTMELPFNHAPDTPTASSPSPSAFSGGHPHFDLLTPDSIISDPFNYASSANEAENGLKIPNVDNSVSQIPNRADFNINHSAAHQSTAPIHSRGIDTTVQQMHNRSLMSNNGVSDPRQRANFASNLGNYPFPDMMQSNFSRLDLYEPHQHFFASLTVLIAEDNPVNAKVLKRRLEKRGHTVSVAVDGQECFDMYVAAVQKFDVVLMDLQMPLVSGSLSAKMIRQLERKASQGKSKRERVPIFAVSASMTEDLRFDYIEDGFDAWVMKPIMYPRLEDLLRGIYSIEDRRAAAYVPGAFENGGWFHH